MTSLRDRRPWWDTGLSASTSAVIALLNVALAVVGLVQALLTFGDGLGFALAVAQFGVGAALALVHVATRRRRLQEQHD